jgi:hypothetical protein
VVVRLMNESANSTSATHSSNGDSSNCVGPLLNVGTTLALVYQKNNLMAGES